jgi:hypothetical protein
LTLLPVIFNEAGFVEREDVFPSQRLPAGSCGEPPETIRSGTIRGKFPMVVFHAHSQIEQVKDE